MKIWGFPVVEAPAGYFERKREEGERAGRALRVWWELQKVRSPVLFYIRLHWLAFKMARNFARRQLELERRTMEALAHRERQARLAAIKERDAATRPRPQYPY